MEEDEKVTEYVSKIQKLVHLMKGCGETLTDKMIIDKVMRMLTSHFDQIIVAIQESNNLENNEQKKAHNKVKKKDCKTAYCTQTTVNVANFDKISHAETTKEA